MASTSNSMQRNSSFELLKIFAVIIITISHAVPFAGEIIQQAPYIISSGATTNINQLIILNFRMGG